MTIGIVHFRNVNRKYFITNKALDFFMIKIFFQN